MAKVLVTGASGFIGSNLTAALAAQADEVTCLVRRTSRSDPLRALGVKCVYGDVTDPESLRPAIAGQEVVYHVAGLPTVLRPVDFYRVNSAGTFHVARLCAEQSRPPVLVTVSSLAAAGPSPQGRPRTETDPLVQVSEYGRSKLAAERAARRFADRVPTTIVRPPIVFGPWDRAGLEMFRPVDRFGIHFVPRTARHRFSVIHVEDLVQLLILAAQRGSRLLSEDACRDEPPAVARARGVYFAACEIHPAYVDLGRMIGTALGRRRVLPILTATPLVWMVATGVELAARIARRPLYLNLDKACEMTAGSWTCSPRAAMTDLGFAVRAPLPERLRQTVQWYRQQGWL